MGIFGFGKKNKNSISFPPVKETGKVEQEKAHSAFSITITSEYVQIDHPKRKPERICWDDIVEIWIITTDDGPFLPDVWLALCGTNSGCLIPDEDHDDYMKVYDIVSKYEGFDFQNVVNAASCAINNRFLVWRKKGSPPILS